MTKLSAMKIWIEKDGRYQHMKASFCQIDTERHSDASISCQTGEISHDCYDEFRWMRDLEISSQANRDDDDSHYYGFKICKRVCYSMDSYDCRDMLKVVDPIERKVAKHESKFGNATCVAEFIFNVAHACKIEHFLFRNDANNVLGYSYANVDGHGLSRLRRVERESLEKVAVLS